MAHRLTFRRVSEAAAVWLAAWLPAREALLTLFDFHPLRLFVWCGVLALLLALWLRSAKSRLAGLIALGAAFALLCVWPASHAHPVRPFQRVIDFGFDFGDWLSRSVPAADMPHDPRFGAALWLLFALGGALLAVLLLRLLRAPVWAALVYCGVFTSLQLLTEGVHPDTARLLLTLLAVLCCCAWIWSGKRWERSRRTRSYARWQRGMALALLPALLVTAAVAGGTRMDWRSQRFAWDVETLTETIGNWFAVAGGGSIPTENLDQIALGGDREELGIASFDFKLAREGQTTGRIYLRTAVFDRYTGFAWQRSEAMAGDEAYLPGTEEFLTALRSGSGTPSMFRLIEFTLRDFHYGTRRVPAPQNAALLAATRLSAVTDARNKLGASRVVEVSVVGDQAKGARLLFGYDDDRGVRQYAALPDVPLSANRFGEVTSSEPLRSQYLVGAFYEPLDPPAFEDGVEKPWSRQVASQLSKTSFGNYDAAELADLRAQYLDLPVTLPPEVRALAARLRQNRPDQTAERIRAYLMKSFSYTLTPATTDRDFVSSFLFDVREGYCTSFASAMVVLSRCCGIPARYVEGYLVDHAAAAAGTTVTDAERHAWAELYFPGSGWLTYDATAFTAAGSAPVGREELDVTPYEQPEETPAEELPDKEEQPEEKPTPEQTPTDENKAEQPGAGTRRGLPVWLTVLLALALACGAAYGALRLRLRLWRRTQRRYRAGERPLLAAYAELRRCAGALGVRDDPTQTVEDYFRGLGPMGLDENARLQCPRAAQGVNVAAYAGREPDADARAALCDILDGAYRRLIALRGRWWLALWWRRGRS